MKIYIFQPTASIVSTVCHKNFELAAVQYFISNIPIFHSDGERRRDQEFIWF